VLLEPIMAVEVVTPEEFMGESSATSARGAARSSAWTRAARAGDPGARAAGADVRLRDRCPVDDAGGARLIRCSSPPL
jgi:hypothetical protein